MDNIPIRKYNAFMLEKYARCATWDNLWVFAETEDFKELSFFIWDAQSCRTLAGAYKWKVIYQKLKELVCIKQN